MEKTTYKYSGWILTVFGLGVFILARTGGVLQRSMSITGGVVEREAAYPLTWMFAGFILFAMGVFFLLKSRD